MKKYVLGPNAARQLKKLLRGSGEVSRRDNLSTGLAFGSEYANPYAVQWAQSANDGAGSWIIWLPGDALLVVDGVTIDVREDLEAVGGDYPDGWYLLGGAIEGDGTLYLDIHFQAADDEDPVSAEFSSGDGGDGEGEGGVGADDGEDEERVVRVAICEVSTDDSTGARSVLQFVTSTIVLGGEGLTLDDVSLDRIEDEESEKNGAAQVKDFDNEESDGGQGLAERLELKKSGSGESATYKIVAKANDSKVHILARVNGKIKYIPLTGKDEKDPDEENPPPDKDDCEHPGDGDNSGGVKPDDDEPGGGGNVLHGGGVNPGDGAVHPGDDDCNCDK